MEMIRSGQMRLVKTFTDDMPEIFLIKALGPVEFMEEIKKAKIPNSI